MFKVGENVAIGYLSDGRWQGLSINPGGSSIGIVAKVGRKKVHLTNGQSYSMYNKPNDDIWNAYPKEMIPELTKMYWNQNEYAKKIKLF